MAAASSTNGSNAKGDINGLAQLISSLDLKTTGPSQPGAKPLDARSAQALAEKLHEILGDDSAGPAVRRNEHGQVLNEEGLPVIEITENAAPNQPPRRPQAIPQVTTHIPLSSLTEAQKEERRREVERMLDELEKEEEEEERRRQAEELVKEEQIRKEEKERAAENMAKALTATHKVQSQQHERLQAPAAAVPSATRPSPSILPPSPTALERKSSKKVTFADEASEDPHASGNSEELGDVILGRLRSKKGTSAALADQPMKLNVVERIPSATSASKGSKVQIVDDDSDDEIEFAEGEGGFLPLQSHSQQSQSETGSRESEIDQEDDDVEEEDDEGVEDDDDESIGSGDDFDTAMLQREAAAIYYSKREDLRAGTGAFAGFGQIAVPGEGWDPEEVDALGSTSAKKKAYTVSRFKSARVARSFIQTGALPPGTTIRDKDLVGLVRQGKLDGDDELVVNEDDEVEDEEDLGPRGHEILEALRRGEMPVAVQDTNGGPSAASNSKPLVAASPQPREDGLPAGPPKVSRFKAAKQAAHDQGAAATTAESKAAQQPRTAALASSVKERATRSEQDVRPPAGSPVVEASTPPAKVSRFKAQRMG